MKRIGQKQLSLLLCLVLLFTMAIPAGARASDYFNNTYVSATAVGGGTLRIKVDVAASGIMQELGATEIIVHERQANGTYKPVRTFTRNQNANLIRKNCASNVISLTYKGTLKILLHHRALLRQKRQRHRGHLIGSNAVRA